jgi:hypothetical protein
MRAQAWPGCPKSGTTTMLVLMNRAASGVVARRTAACLIAIWQQRFDDYLAHLWLRGSARSAMIGH